MKLGNLNASRERQKRTQSLPALPLWAAFHQHSNVNNPHEFLVSKTWAGRGEAAARSMSYALRHSSERPLSSVKMTN